MVTMKTSSCLAVLVLAVSIAQAQNAPVVPADSVVNNASFVAGTNPLAPGTIAAIFGSNLDDGSKNPFSAFGANGELLTTLGGASATSGCRPLAMRSWRKASCGCTRRTPTRKSSSS